MSTKRRKIGYNFIELHDLEDEESSLDPKLLLDVIEAAESYDRETRSLHIPSSNRWHWLFSVEKNTDNTTSLLFKSCKYNHKPPLLNHKTGSERDNPKVLDEGESEATHILMGYQKGRATFLFEERQAGIAFGKFTSFLSDITSIYYHSKNEKIPFKLVSGHFGSNEFIKELRKMKRVTVAELRYPVPRGNSDIAKQMDRHREARREVTTTVNVERGKSLFEFVTDLHKDDKSMRIRAYCQDESDNPAIVDTLLSKTKKYVDTNIDVATGVVDSARLFLQLRKLMKEIQ